MNKKYVLVNFKTIARPDGMFLNDRYVRLDTLKIKCHQVAPIFIKEGGIGDN